MTNWDAYIKIKNAIHDSARESKISLFELIGIVTMLKAELVEAAFEADKDPGQAADHNIYYFKMN